jgi:hypothetical protein
MGLIFGEKVILGKGIVVCDFQNFLIWWTSLLWINIFRGIFNVLLAG